MNVRLYLQADSNPGQLDEKHERYLCALPYPLLTLRKVIWNVFNCSTGFLNSSKSLFAFTSLYILYTFAFVILCFTFVFTSAQVLYGMDPSRLHDWLMVVFMRPFLCWPQWRSADNFCSSSDEERGALMTKYRTKESLAKRPRSWGVA